MGPGSSNDEIKRSIVDASRKGQGAAARGPERSEDDMIGSMQILKRSIDFTMILALSGLGIMATVLILQGFRIYGFYLDVSVLTALVPSLSAAAALRVFDRTGRGVMAPRGR